MIFNQAITDWSDLAVDKFADVSASSTVSIATSDQRYFEYDSVLIRGTWRVGHAVVRPEQIGKFTIGDAS